MHKNSTLSLNASTLGEKHDKFNESNFFNNNTDF